MLHIEYIMPCMTCLFRKAVSVLNDSDITPVSNEHLETSLHKWDIFHNIGYIVEEWRKNAGPLDRIHRES